MALGVQLKVRLSTPTLIFSDTRRATSSLSRCFRCHGIYLVCVCVCVCVYLLNCT